jgi:Uncharacterized protein conserved in bacteria
MDDFRARIVAVLTVPDPGAAVAFYVRALGARELYRNQYPDGRFVAELAVDDAHFRVAPSTVASGDAADHSPEQLGGTTVRINLLVPDPDAIAAQAVAAGARQVAPIADQPYGLRQGRVVDPFGHHWLIGRPLDDGSGDWARG